MKKLHHGVCYYPELWPGSDVERDIAEMKRLGITFVRVGEFSWSNIEPVEGRVSLDLWRDVLDRMHAAGIGVVFCTPTPTPPIWLTHGHPDRCFVDAEGRVMSHGARQHASYENPDVRAACMRIVEAIATALGRHPAILAWQIDNEFKCHVAEDFNPHAIKSWHRWLENRYRSIDILNAAWGTDIWSERYQRFDQVPAPVTTPFLHNASLSTAYRLFSRERIAEFMDEQAAILRRHSAAPITHNMHPQFAINVERMSANLDFVSFDDYPDRTQWSAIVFDNDLMRPAKPGRAHWLMETSVAHNGWLGNHEAVHPPGFLPAEAVASYALGAETICYWPWRQQRSGCELPHSAVMSAWFRPSVGYVEVQKVEQARAALEPWLVASRPAPAEVAITWSDRGRAMLETEPLGASKVHEVKYHATIAAWHRLLCDAGYHREIRLESASLDGLKVLVTPLMPHVSEEFLGRVEEFVRKGGVWVCAPVTGTRTAEHTVPTDAALGAVEQLAGVETVFAFPITGTGATGEGFGTTAALAGWCCALRPADGVTRVVGTLHSDVAPGLAFVTERAVGAGYIVVIGAQPQGDAGQAILRGLIDHYAVRTGVTQRYDATPGTLVCPRLGVNGGDGWVVVNLDGQGGDVKIPAVGRDAVGGARVSAGRLTLGNYEWRAIVFDA